MDRQVGRSLDCAGHVWHSFWLGYPLHICKSVPFGKRLATYHDQMTALNNCLPGGRVPVNRICVSDRCKWNTALHPRRCVSPIHASDV